jgi:hypothetical protein
METKEPVVLAVLVESARLCWFVASVGRGGAVAPLLRSAEGDLATCRGLDFDDQVSFLRHRFCGVLQRGCDRLWPAGKRAGQFAFLFDGHLPGTDRELTRRVSDHFAEWLLNPPAVVFTREGNAGSAAPAWVRLAGTIEPPFENDLRTALAPLLDLAADPDAWEVSNRKGTWRPPSEADREPA